MPRHARAGERVRVDPDALHGGEVGTVLGTEGHALPSVRVQLDGGAVCLYSPSLLQPAPAKAPGGRQAGGGVSECPSGR